MRLQIRCGMEFNNDISSSGPVPAQDLNVSKHFTEYTELPSKGYSCLFRAQRYGVWHVIMGVKPQYAGDPQYAAMLDKEFVQTMKLNHPNIVRVYGRETDPVVGDCMVMEYIDGRSLNEFLKENPPLTARRQVITELLEALAYFHRKQVVHQDLKPSNILITNDGNHVKVIDFGFADSRDYAIIKNPSYSAAYAAPEQLSGGEVDNRTDLYAFGLILKKVFPSRYGNVVRKCLQPQKQKRYASAESVLHAIGKADRKRKLLPILASVVLVVVGVLCAFFHPVSYISGKVEDYRILHTVGDTSQLAGALDGVFSVAPGKQVRFSKGNLQFSAAGKHRTADGIAQGTWRFAENQYDFVGMSNANISSHYEDWIDHFGFGTSGWNSGTVSFEPYSWAIENIGYYPGGKWENSLTDSCAFADWGVYNAISNGGNMPGRWRTLTKDEAVYLCQTRNASTVKGIPNARFVKAIVNGVNGLILFPDEYSHPDDVPLPENINIDTAQYTGNYTVSQWKAMEDAGAVFLPEAGARGGLEWSPGTGHYWCSTAYNNACAYNLAFSDVGVDPQSYAYRLYGMSVRLVQNVPK